MLHLVAFKRRPHWCALQVGPAAGYVYCHQACCQHVLEVRDVRQLHREDPQKKSDWPHTIFKVRLATTGQNLHSRVTLAWLPSWWAAGAHACSKHVQSSPEPGRMQPLEGSGRPSTPCLHVLPPTVCIS